jgi:putative ABC transport system permease protein
VIIALIIYTLTMDKLRSIATLKLMGAPDRVIIWLIVQHALVLGAAGYAIGFGLIEQVKSHFPRRVELQPRDLAILAGVVLLICLIGSLLGVRAAVKIDPAEALASG